MTFKLKPRSRVRPVFSLFVLALAACGETKSSFTNIEAVPQRKQKVSTESEDVNKSSQTTKASGESAATFNAVPGFESFSTAGATPPPNDFVFVVDNSRSMRPLIEKFVNGFEKLSAEDYPKDARLSVMSTMIAMPDDFSKPMEASSITSGICAEAGKSQQTVGQQVTHEIKVLSSEPGFLKFIKASETNAFAQSINAYKLFEGNSNRHGCTFSHSEIRTNYFTSPLCASEWFSPSDKNSAGQSCLKSAMLNISGLSFVEAGMTAISQMMEKNRSNPLFREGASVHFVVISDTHDPGFEDESGLIAMPVPPSFQKIDAAVRGNSKVSSVKLHGVVPFAKCPSGGTGGEETYGFSYLKEIKASAGIQKDSCVANADYKQIVNQIFSEAKKLAPFRLKARAVKDVEVKVNGTKWSEFKVVNNNSVEIEKLDPSESYKIDVSYVVTEPE